MRMNNQSSSLPSQGNSRREHHKDSLESIECFEEIDRVGKVDGRIHTSKKGGMQVYWSSQSSVELPEWVSYDECLR